MKTFDDATLAQVDAADPTKSTWLSANAGSGKTRVLTDRVARLLLEGVDPRRVLCLTFTKAAAGEMQNRLFGRLGDWAMLPDDRLAEALDDLGVSGIDDFDRARRLFATAIETPGGLKIQTIHSFCASLLRHYPLEAGISPRFAEMDETSERLLAAEVADSLAEDDEDGVVQGVARYHSGHEFEKLLGDIAGNADAFRTPPDRAALCRDMGIPPDFRAEDLHAVAFDGGESALMAAVVPILAAGSQRDQGAATRLAPLANRPLGLADLDVLESVFLTGATANSPFTSKAGTFPTKGTREALGGLADDLDALMDRVETARHHRVALAAIDQTLALHRFATVFLDRFEAEKARRGWLGFDDLIGRARALLSDRAVADWVLYRLDGGIDHILVDEAQDTSPAQWAVIERLADEFAAGVGAHADRRRTLFVVGDRKQSIYSFQGAEAESFDRMRDHFEERLRSHNPLSRRELVWSFRSSPAVLDAVDATFAGAEGGVDADVRHNAFRGTLPGRVDLWPLVAEAKKPEPVPWFMPVDRVSEEHHTISLARTVAHEIARLLRDGATIPDKTGKLKALAADDILILVQRRGGRPSLFHEIIAALKAERVPVAGADRLKLRDSLAVRDVIALLTFLSLPEDDLSLATALRSPIFGLSEDALFRLAHGRGEAYLWRVLRDRADTHPEVVEALRALRAQSDFLRPYDLIERILVRLDGRRKLVARLGAEAEDGIDELLNLALAYEQTEIPSLTGFLSWLEAEDTVIKRQLGTAKGQVRVMTVHGAKGLEAPMVILPDASHDGPGGGGGIAVCENGRPHWLPPKPERPPFLSGIADRDTRAAERERDRLLYVAMTRAQTWLVVCGAGKAKDGTWHDRIGQALGTLDARPLVGPTGAGLRYETGDWSGPQVAEGPKPAPEIALPDWAGNRPSPAVKPPGAVSPSNLGGDKALPGETAPDDEGTGLIRGRRIHRLLEHLPTHDPGLWADLAAALLATGEDPTDPDTAAVLLAEVAPLLSDAALAPLFAPGTLAEVPFACRPPELNGRLLAGAIDRLIVAPDRVLAIDYKTNLLIPDTPEAVPEGLKRQMGAYARALSMIYPDRRIETAILWTRGPLFMPLPHDMVSAAWERRATS